MRVVLDTNVLLSAAFFPGVCDKLLVHSLLTPDVELVLSQHILDEFMEHGAGKLQGSPDRLEAFANELRQHAQWVQPTPIPTEAFDDVDDLPVLGTAIAGQATYLVTGDKALMALGTYQGVIILSPRHFLDRVRS